MDSLSAENIVSAFTAILEKQALPAACQVADVRELPYPKDQIKAAFHWMFLNAEDDRHRELLLAACIYLSKYQIGVGPQRIGPGSSDLPANPKRLSPAELMRFGKEYSTKYSEYQKWMPIVQADEALLLAELQRLWREVHPTYPSIKEWTKRERSDS